MIRPFPVAFYGTGEQMLVEFIGCTGSGKTTFAARIVNRLAHVGAQVILADEFMLQTVGCERTGNALTKRALVNVLAMSECVRQARAYAAVYAFSARMLWQNADSTFFWPLLYRNVLKRLGIYATIMRKETANEIVILDEGTLHIAHNLFVHLQTEPHPDDIAQFASIIPLPDLVILVQAPIQHCVERTIERGHRRLKSGSRAEVERFVKHAHQVFEQLSNLRCVEDRLLTVENCGHGICETNDTTERIVDLILAKGSRKNSTKKNRSAECHE
jgi:thymidylate kinase